MKIDFRRKVPLIAVCHLPALAGRKGHTTQREVIEHALHDLAVCEENGVDAILFENENDMPYDVEVDCAAVASMTAMLGAVMNKRKNVAIGVEYLINDPVASLMSAYAVGADFIRTDYFVDRMARSEYGGEMKIDPVGLVKLRYQLAAKSGYRISIFADVQVKYATLLEEGKPLSTSCEEAHLHGANAAIISGVATGSAPAASDFIVARDGTKVGPLFIGSGLGPENAAELVPVIDGAIVGTSLMQDGLLSATKVRDLLEFFGPL